MIRISTLTWLQRNCVNAVMKILGSSEALRSRKEYLDKQNFWSSSDEFSRLGVLLRFRSFRKHVKDIIDTERELLGMLDEQMKGCERNHRHPNSVMFGLCLRRLSLIYRRELSQYRLFKSRCPSVIRVPSAKER